MNLNGGRLFDYVDTHPVINMLTQQLIQWKLIGSSRNATAVRIDDSDPNLYAPFRAGGINSAFIQARRLSGMPQLIMAVVSFRADFEGDLNSSVNATIVSTTVILTVAIILALTFIHFFTRPLLRLVSFMKQLEQITEQSHVSLVACGRDQIPTSERYQRLLHKWLRVSSSPSDSPSFPAVVGVSPSAHSVEEHSGNPNSPNASRSSSRRRCGSFTPHRVASVRIACHHRVVLACMAWCRTKRDSNSHSDTPLDVASRQTACCPALCSPFFSFRRGSVREMRKMESAFSSVLHALTLAESQYEKATSAKRHFIRYIFHELRVPFNALTLAIQQLRLEHDHIAQAMPDVADTIQLMEDQGRLPGLKQ